jgi:hypothetical protein
VRVLRRGDDALSFVEPLLPDFAERFRELLIEFREHRATSALRLRMQSALPF